MRKTVIKSPWGNFIKIEVGKRTYERTAQGNFWIPGLWKLGAHRSVVLDFLAWLLPVAEVEEDKFIQQLRQQFPDRDIHTNVWRES